MGSTMNGFKSKAEAQDAGFVRAAYGEVHKYRGMILHSMDVSGSGARGHAFEIHLNAENNNWGFDGEAWKKANFLAALMEQAGVQKSQSGWGYALGKSQRIWYTEDLDQIEQSDCFTVAYHQDTIDAAIKKAEEIIDAYRAFYPEQLPG